jgi:DinB superfamily
MNSQHQKRMLAAVRSLESATAAFAAYLRQLPAETATTPLPGGWTPAGHAAHLALTNEVFVGIIKGTAPLPTFAGQSDYSTDRWNLEAPPTGVIAPSILVPSADITCSDALANLQQSVDRLRPAILSMTPDAASSCVKLPWAVVSLDQMAEWGGGHTMRHLSQISRELQLAATQA